MFSLGPATPPDNGRRQTYKYNGDWAEGELYFNGCLCLFRVQQRISQDGTTVACTVQPRKPVDEYHSGMLEKVLKFGTRKTGSRIRFGIIHLRSIEEQGKWPISLGFEFIAMNLATWELATSEQTLQRVVGIKIPAKNDVASGFLLNQVLRWPADMSYLVHEPRHLLAHMAPRDRQAMGENDGSSGRGAKTWAEKFEASSAIFSTRRDETTRHWGK
ncbi:hypothetical protein ONS96_012019 [Cadophora gregata f. sp. sojae]|nr:hypothetical protein ONS96_012019 [Cadophora gregata f. sp. sojae]